MELAPKCLLKGDGGGGGKGDLGHALEQVGGHRSCFPASPPQPDLLAWPKKPPPSCLSWEQVLGCDGSAGWLPTPLSRSQGH